MASFPLPVDTRHVTIESRQHELFGRDLGEGVARWKLVLGLVLYAPWIFLCGPVLGVPVLGWQTGIYLAPPAMLIAIGCRLDRGDRPLLFGWIDRLRYLARRHRPLTPRAGGGRVAAPFLIRDEFRVIDLAPFEARFNRDRKERTP